MNKQNNCTNYREDIAALMLGVLEPKDAEKLQKHLETCQNCNSLYEAMLNEEKDIRPSFKEIALKGEAIQNSLIEKLDNNELETVNAPKAVKINWSKIIRSPLIKFAAAAVILLIILGGMNFWPFNSSNKEQWWLGSSVVWGRDIITQLNNIETLVYRQQTVFVRPNGWTHVSGTWSRYYQAKDRAIIERYYEQTDEDSFGDVKPDSILQNVTFNLPDVNNLITYNLSYEYKCYSIREYKGEAYIKDPVENLLFYVNLLDKADQILNIETFEGKKCIGFEIRASKYGDNPPERIDRIWFDVETKLPVRIENHGITITGQPGTTLTNIIDRFVYYAQIPSELFVPNIPDDFINAEPSEIQKVMEEQEKSQMIYADVPPELVDATVKAINSVENVVYWLHIGISQNGEQKYFQNREQLISRYTWRENVYFNDELQQTEWYITSQSDWGKTSFDFNDKKFSVVQIILNNSQHTYKTITYGRSSHPDNPLDRIIFLEGWFNKADKFFENEEIDGKECYGFELSARKYGTNPDTTKHRLWFDKKTNLPVRIEDEWLEDDGPRTMIKDQFEWNMEFPIDTFIPDIPKDYTLQEEHSEK
jgi:outer membrane lipoprotein-sorting protein